MFIMVLVNMLYVFYSLILCYISNFMGYKKNNLYLSLKNLSSVE